MGELTTAKTVIAAAAQLMPSTQMPGAGTTAAVRIPISAEAETVTALLVTGIVSPTEATLEE